MVLVTKYLVLLVEYGTWYLPTDMVLVTKYLVLVEYGTWYLPTDMVLVTAWP